jgi:threonine dehydrogenase-like Zn-dependent dehydrogenase
MKTCKFFQGMMVAALLAAVPVTAVWAAHRSEAEAAIAAAKAAMEKAAAAGVATDEISALIEKAEGLLPSRQYTKAIEASSLATKEAEFAVKQTEGTVDAAAGEKKALAERGISDAEAARKKASEVGGEWRDTGKMIKQAEDAVKTGEFDKAISLATQAKRQGELGYAQAMGEKDASFPSYMTKK